MTVVISSLASIVSETRFRYYRSLVTERRYLHAGDRTLVWYKMEKRLEKCLPLLSHIMELTRKERRRWIMSCDRELIDCLSECSRNILQGKVPLTDDEYEELRRNKETLRRLALKKTSLAKKRKFLQKAGLVEDILTPVLTVLSSNLTTANDDTDDDSREIYDEEDSVQSSPGVSPSLEYVSIDSNGDRKTADGTYTCAEPGCRATYPYLRNLSRHTKLKHHRRIDGRPASPSTIEKAKMSSRHRIRY